MDPTRDQSKDKSIYDQIATNLPFNQNPNEDALPEEEEEEEEEEKEE